MNKEEKKFVPLKFTWTDYFSMKRKASGLREVLKKNVLFQDLSFSELRYLERIIHIRHYEPGEIIFNQNDTGIGMYIISKGRVLISVGQSHMDGFKIVSDNVPITELTSGSFFGEQALIETDSVRTASAVAMEPTTLIAFLKPDLMNIVQRKPTLGVKIILRLSRVLGVRLRKTTEKITKLSSVYETDDKDD